MKVGRKFLNTTKQYLCIKALICLESNILLDIQCSGDCDKCINKAAEDGILEITENDKEVDDEPTKKD